MGDRSEEESERDMVGREEEEIRWRRMELVSLVNSSEMSRSSL